MREWRCPQQRKASLGDVHVQLLPVWNMMVCNRLVSDRLVCNFAEKVWFLNILLKFLFKHPALSDLIIYFYRLFHTYDQVYYSMKLSIYRIPFERIKYLQKPLLWWINQLKSCSSINLNTDNPNTPLSLYCSGWRGPAGLDPLAYHHRL